MDPGHRYTEELLASLERDLTALYSEAAAGVEETLADHLRRLEAKDATWKRWVSEGTRTQAEYDQWRTGQIMMGRRWEELRQTLAEDMHHANEVAKSIVEGYTPEIYALNHNYATFEVETGVMVDTSYTLYDRQTVERLMRDDPQMLPAPGRRVSARIAAGKDVRWNNQQIQSVMTQSILQGESIPRIATRLANTVGDSNRKAAIRNARTMTTAAENAGRVDGYKRAQGMGIKLKQQWMATLDGRTRHSHRAMDGETVEVDGTFSNGCRYPGDPRGDPSEIYNCRCTLVASLEGFERDLSDLSLRNDSKLDGMSYEEWLEGHGASESITKPDEISQIMRRTYIAEYRRK